MEKEKLNKSRKTATGQPKDEINIRPKELKEAVNKSAVITFGRMNPPTVGHLLLANKVVKTARSQRATPLIFLSHSQDPKKNPLSYTEKLRLAKAAFGRNIVVDSPAKTIIEVLKQLQSAYNSVTLVVGSDRVSEFKRIVDTYNGRDFKFKTVDVVSAGTRDPDSEGVSGMSASKMREHAAKNNAGEFKRGLPPQLQSMADMVLQMVRSGMNITEETINEEENLDEAVYIPTIANRRKRALSARKHKGKLRFGARRQATRFASSLRFKKRSRRAARKLVKKRLAGIKGANYSKLSAAEKMAIDKKVSRATGLIGKLAKKLLPAVRRANLRRLREGFIDESFENYLIETEQTVNVNSINEMTVIVDKFLAHLNATTFNESDISSKALRNIERKSEESGIDLYTLTDVFKEGYNNPKSGQTNEQSAFLALNRFISEKEVWDKPMPEKAKRGKLSSSQKAKAKARAKAAGRPYPNMVDNMWASRNEDVNNAFEEIERRADFKTVKVKLPNGKIVMRKQRKEIHIEAIDQTKAVDARQEREKRSMLIRHTRQDANAKVKDIVNKVNEEFEQLDEIYFQVDIEGLPSMYIEAPSASSIKRDLRILLKKPDSAIKDIVRVTPADVRKAFRDRAQGKSLDDIEERALTSGEMKKREDVVKSLKKVKGDFSKRYGKDGESVMYAVATKIAKNKK